MRSTDVLIIGGGQAGLAMSHCLTDRGVDHLVVERGRIGERWRSERWDSLRLLTPNWMTRLPGRTYGGPDPDGFMSREALASLLADYAAGFAAPIMADTAVTSVTKAGDGYHVETSRGPILTGAVVIATGACDIPHVPASADALDPDIAQVVPAQYRRPDLLPAGGVLVVGASSTGLQLAREIHASGRPVTLAAGRHTRMVRRYRGRDIFAWMEDAGINDERWTDIGDLAAARRAPSMQLSADGALALADMAAQGIRVTGRVETVAGTQVTFGRDLAADCATSDARLARTLARIDAHIAKEGLEAPADAAAWQTPPHPEAAAGTLDLAGAGIRTVLWATGYRRDYGWLKVPVTDAEGELIHEGGVTPAPGLYALGLRLLRRRSSNFIDGVGRDAEALAEHIAARVVSRSLAA